MAIHDQLATEFGVDEMEVLRHVDDVHLWHVWVCALLEVTLGLAYYIGMVLVPATTAVVTMLIGASLVPCSAPFGYGFVRLRHWVVSRQGCCGCLSEGVEKGAKNGNFGESGRLGNVVYGTNCAGHDWLEFSVLALFRAWTREEERRTGFRRSTQNPSLLAGPSTEIKTVWAI